MIITIIVLLILAGITIAALTGSDSAPAKANEAKQKNDIGAAKDDVAITVQNALTDAYTSAYVDGGSTKGSASTDVGSAVISAVNEKYEEEVQLGLANIKSETKSDGNGKVTIWTTDFKVIGTIDKNGGVLSWGEIGANGGGQEQGQGGDVPPVIQTISSKKTAVGATVQAVNATANTTLEDDLGNEVIIPAGFGIAEDSGTKVEEGIVIEDATNGNQFVWVPVGTNINVSETIDSTKKIDIPIGRYIFKDDGTIDKQLTPSNQTDPTIQICRDTENELYFSERLISDTAVNKNAKAKNIVEFIDSAVDNKGYYIGRYEAGLSGEIDQTTLAGFVWNNDYTERIANDSTKIVATDGSVKPLIQKGKGVWNDITQLDASRLCQEMYSNINSDLTNGYAWDTAILFIEKCGGKPTYASEKILNTCNLEKTGNAFFNANYDKVCNICDMLGNVTEWVTEYSDYTEDGIDYPCVCRGSYYDDGGSGYNDVRSAGIGWVDLHDDTTGFRPILYF